MHTASVSACAASQPEEMARYYKKCGYTGIIVTDHFINGNTSCPQYLPWEKKIEFFANGYERAKKEGDKIGLDVFFGLEYSYKGTDFLVYGLQPEYLIAHPDFHMLDMKNFSSAVRGGGGFLAQAHPFRKEWWIADPTPASPELIDAVEVHNLAMSDEVNRKAFEYAEKHNLPMMAGSDAHCDYLKKPAGIVLKKRAESIFDIIDAIKAGKIELVKGKI
jgi:hypothetical protein